MKLTRRDLLKMLASTTIAPTAAVSGWRWTPVQDLRPRHGPVAGTPDWFQMTTDAIVDVIQRSGETTQHLPDPARD